MVTLLLILIATTFHCASAHRCELNQLFCISSRIVWNACGDKCHQKRFEMHWKGANKYTEDINVIDIFWRFAIRRKGSTKSIHAIRRTVVGSYPSSSPYFECDKHSCDEKKASLIIDSALKRGEIVNYISSDGSLKYVLENKDGDIIRHKPYCAPAGHASIAAFCIDDTFQVHISLPLPVLTEQVFQLQKGDQFIIPGYSYTVNRGKKPKTGSLIHLERIKFASTSFVWVGIKKGSLIKIGRHQWQKRVEGEGTQKKRKRAVVDAINEALRHRVKTFTLNRDRKVIGTITAEEGWQTPGGTAHAVTEYEDILQDVTDDEFLQGFEDGYRAAERLLSRLK